VRNRRCYCVNCWLYDQEGTVDFVEADTLGGMLKEYHPAHSQYATKTFRVPKDAAGKTKTVRKPARTIRSILKECAAPPIIDYWSLDTEGSEFTILKSFPFDEYSFRVLTVEHNRLPVRHQIGQFLQGHGYRLVREMGIDDCYVKDISLPSLSWRSQAWRRTRKGNC